MRNFPHVHLHPTDRIAMRNGSTESVRATVTRLAAQVFPWTMSHTEARLHHVQGQIFELVTWAKGQEGITGTIVAQLPLRPMREWLRRRYLGPARCA